MSSDRRKPARALALLMAMTALVAVGATSTASADVKLSWVKGKPLTLAGGAATGTEYASASIYWLPCPGKATAVMAGWSGPKAPVALIYSHLVQTSRQMGLAVRRPMAPGKFRGGALCLSGARVTTRERPSGTVECGRNQLALGVPIDSGPYWTEPIAGKPVGARGWVNTGQGTYGRSKAICVPAKALRRVKRIRTAARFAPGSATATVGARCAGGRRPVSWGFEAGPLPENGWRSSQSAVTMSVPLIATSTPVGKAGWRLVFATPDGAPAKTSTDLAIHLTCAQPA